MWGNAVSVRGGVGAGSARLPVAAGGGLRLLVARQHQWRLADCTRLLLLLLARSCWWRANASEVPHVPHKHPTHATCVIQSKHVPAPEHFIQYGVV